jgi:hypothetical protein
MSSMRIVRYVSIVLPRDFLDTCTRHQNDGSLRAELICSTPMRVATLSLENVLLLPLSLFVDPAAVAPVVVGVRVCTAEAMLWLMIAPMSSAVGFRTYAGRCVGPGSPPAVDTLAEDGPGVVLRCCTIQL